MAATLSPIVDPRELAAREARRGLVLVDARSGPDCRARYQAGHLAGAVHVHLDHDLSQKPADPRDGGRHPLPEPRAFAAVLGRLGIVGPDVRVVVYDDKGGANAAARFWWMLRAAGHEAVQVLDGGMQAGAAAGIPIETGEPDKTIGPHYPFDAWARGTVELEEVARAAGDPRRLVLDVREPARFRGESDPFDPEPGHIPGAVNVPYAGNLGIDGRFLTQGELRAKYRSLLGDHAPGDVIVSCGSGVTACHTLLALERAGIAGPKLYVGSYSEWSRSGRPIAKGE